MEDKVRAAVRVVLSTGNLEDLTSRKVREAVEQSLGFPVAEYKEIIKDEINKCLLEQAPGDQVPQPIPQAVIATTAPGAVQPEQLVNVAVNPILSTHAPNAPEAKKRSQFIEGGASLPKKRRKKVEEVVQMEPVEESEAEEEEEEEEDQEFEVERVVARRVVEGAPHYLIKWKGYPDSDNTWEPEENLSCPVTLKLYEQRLPDFLDISARAEKLVEKLGGTSWTGYEQYKAYSSTLEKTATLIRKAASIQEKKGSLRVLKSSSLLRELLDIVKKGKNIKHEFDASGGVNTAK